jgi:hypothetical protein
VIHPRFLRIIQIIIDILLIQVGYVLAFLIRYLGGISRGKLSCLFAFDSMDLVVVNYSFFCI